jgi:insertion element IS1 protein InsB
LTSRTLIAIWYMIGIVCYLSAGHEYCQRFFRPGYSRQKESKTVVDLKVGKRNKKNIKRVTDTLLLAGCKQIFTDGLDIYKQTIPVAFHKVKRYGTNHIERKNLSLSTHLKRLNRKTIAFSKSLLMLEACLKIYFWHGEPLYS